MNAVISTSKIRIGYPVDREQPKSFRIRAGRSSGSYHFDLTLGSTPNGGVQKDLAIEHILDGSVTGTYYVKVSSIHWDDTQVDGDEFTINVVEPTDDVIAPIVSVY